MLIFVTISSHLIKMLKNYLFVTFIINLKKIKPTLKIYKLKKYINISIEWNIFINSRRSQNVADYDFFRKI